MTIRTVTTAEIAHLVDTGIWRTDRLFRVLDGHAAAHPDRLAVADQHDRFTYAEFVARTQLLAGWLDSLDLPAGSTVALQSGSNALVPALHFACDRADLTFLPLSDAWREREIGHLLAVSEARVVIVPDDTGDHRPADMIASLRADLPHLQLVVTPNPGSGDTSLAEVLPTAPSLAGRADASPDEPRMCMVTSGTSGLPKISLYTDNNLWYFLSVYHDTLESQGPEVFANLAPANTGSTGYLFPVLTPLLFGSSCVMLEHWNPVHALDLLATERVSIAVAVPTQTIKMLDVSLEHQVDLSTLRGLTNAGAPLPPEVAAAVDRTFGCAVLPMYGATDGGVPAMTRVSDPAEARYHSVGKVAEGTEFRIAGPGDVSLPVGEIGEVQWRNPMKTLGYMGPPEQTAAVFTDDGLYRSGDLGHFDDQGYLHIVGRLKDLIIRGGQNISPREIEDVLITMDDVLEVAAFGVPDPVYGERVCVGVVPKTDDLTLESVGAYLLQQGLPRFMLPEQLELFSEFPTNSGGKVSKDVLRAAALERQS